MKRARLIVAAVACVATPALANVLQVERDAVLFQKPRDGIALLRITCATGDAAVSTVRHRAAGFTTLSTGAYCITVLTRAGRDQTLRYVSAKDGRITPAISFDSGFVRGYLKREAVPAGAPAMAALLPLADRCLDQREADANRCGAAGYVLGLRAARGEVVPVS